MPITFTLCSTGTVKMSLPVSELIDVSVHREGFHRSKHVATTPKQGRDLIWAPDT